MLTKEQAVKVGVYGAILFGGSMGLFWVVILGLTE